MVADAQNGGALPPWRDVVQPHAEVRGGTFADWEFAADLARVHASRALRPSPSGNPRPSAARAGGPVQARLPLHPAGRLSRPAASWRAHGAATPAPCIPAPEVHGDAHAFFARTYPTTGLRRLLSTAARRVSGRDGEPVVALRTGFGGGKTHALLAIYHLLSGRLPPSALAGLDIPQPGGVRIAVLCGTDLSPAGPWPCPALGGQSVHTLWGETAAQLGGPEGYSRVQAEDAAGIPPAAGTLAGLLDACSPSAILLDEPLAYLRTLYGRRAAAAGSFDANLTFLHNLTEAARRSRAGLLVAALPAGAAETGGEGGHAAAAALNAIFGRLEAVWQPAEATEGLRIAQRRIFRAPAEDAAAESTCRTFAAMYALGGAAFPPECRTPEYAARLRAAYPFHPELIERLYAGWAPLPGFQGTRGVLRLLAAAVRDLWDRGDGAPLIQPGDLPLHAPAVRGRLTAALGPDWEAVLETDLAGEGTGAATLDRARPRLGDAAAAQRVARTVLLSAPEGGLERARLHLGVLRPGEPPALAGDALDALRHRLAYLHGDAAHVTFRPSANLNRRAADRAAAIETPAAEAEVRRRLEAMTHRRGAEVAAVFGAVHVLGPEPTLPDRPVAALAVLPTAAAYVPGADRQPALTLASALLASCPRYPNMPLFLAADGRDVPCLLDVARACLAWTSLRDGAPGAEAAEGLRGAEQVLVLRLQEAYRWLIVPTQEDAQPVRLEAVELPGGGDPVARAADRAARDQIVLPRWSPALLRLTLDRWLWPDRPHVPVAWVWACLTRYHYLPRLAGWHVLSAAIAAGVADGNYFAYAENAGTDATYVGLRLGVAGVLPRQDGEAVLVRPEAARAQAGGTSPPAGESRPAGAEPLCTRFRARVGLDPARAATETARVVEEVLRHLTATPGCRVSLTLWIDAHAADGLPPATVRTLRENAAALRFEVAEVQDG